jgi:hypothetical protein
MILRDIVHQQIARRYIVLFLWGVLFAYPATTALASIGYFPPKPPIADSELAGAALAEVFRYVSLITLILWLSFTKSAADYLAASSQQPAHAASSTTSAPR